MDLDTFFLEKDLPEKVFEIHHRGLWHCVPSSYVIDMILQTTGEERAIISKTLQRIDIVNGDVMHYLEHLARGLAANYRGALAC